MIAPNMIRKMGKTYTDRQMTKGKRITYQTGAWSNRFIAFKEPLPKHLDTEYDDVQEHDGFWSEIMDNMNLHQTLTQVWPVEIRPFADDSKRIVRMSDGNGLTTWLDAGYLGAILKREPTATFHVARSSDLHPDRTKVVFAKNGQTFAMVMPMVDIKRTIHDSEWSIVNTDLDAAREFDTANELATLLPARPGAKWHTVTHQGLTLEIRRSGRKTYPRSRERVLHVRMIGRDATSHISLYDGRGVYRD